MFRASLALALGFAAAAVNAQQAQQPRQAFVLRTASTYTCQQSPAAPCQFLLYHTDCKEAGVKNGYPALACSVAVFAEFSLKPGESKTFDPIPHNVKQCQPRNGRLVFPECMQ